MSTTTLGAFGFEGPYLSMKPRGLGQERWRAACAGQLGNAEEVALAGGWYAVGLGENQDAASVLLLKDAEKILRRQVDDAQVSQLALGVNIAMQGIGHAHLEMHGLAADRLSEALEILAHAHDRHWGDLAAIAMHLATAQAKIGGTWVGLRRLQDLALYLVGLNHSALVQAIHLRIDLLAKIERQESPQALELYRNSGYHLQMGDGDFEYYLEPMLKALHALFLACKEHETRALATMILRELLLNRNLETCTISSSLDQLTPTLTLLEELRTDLSIPRSAMREPWIWEALTFTEPIDEPHESGWNSQDGLVEPNSAACKVVPKRLPSRRRLRHRADRRRGVALRRSVL